MRVLMTMAGGVLLCCALALAGGWLAALAGVPVPGAVIGLGLYLAWLALGRGIGWSEAGARLLLRWLGAMVVPALVGVTGAAGALGADALRVLALLVVTTLVTALATALIYTAAGGRGW